MVVPDFWAWRVIYVAASDDARSDRLARHIHRHAGRPVHRLRPPAGTWRDTFAAGGVDLAALIEGAPEMGEVLKAEGTYDDGRRAYNPLDIGRAFHRGHLYYTVQTLLTEAEAGEDGVERQVERIETVVVRSDGKLLHAVQPAAPKGTPAARRVLRLSDGTLIDEMPAAPANASWSWPSIEGWLAAKKDDVPTRLRSLAGIVEDVIGAIRASVWLPFEEDYAVLALTAVASYSQAVFRAVPMILLCGEAGSGKSTAGIVISALSANGTIVGQMGARAAARLIHETKGLVVLDDLESISARTSKDVGSFGELIQWLKVSYNQDTATKVWVDAGRSFSVRRLNGFGIKVINNTSGADGILATRMIRVQTCRMPPEQAEDRRRLPPPSAGRLQLLRDELHVWTYENVARIAAAYAEVCPTAAERAEEIAAPLRVFASLSSEPGHAGWLEAALARTTGAAAAPDDPAAVLTEAATAMVRAGYMEASPTHLALEAKRLVGSNPGRVDLPELDQPEWIGRMLRTKRIVSHGETGYRRRLYGANLRIYPFDQEFVTGVLAQVPMPPLRDGADFCRGCSGCAYSVLGCPLERGRKAAEAASLA